MRKLRWIAVAVIMMTLISVAPVQSQASINFTDVKQSNDFYKEVNYIADRGIIKGYIENGKQLYKPAENISRFQASKMLVIATGNENHNPGNLTLKGLKPGSEEYNYISKAVSLGYFKTKADGSIKPFELITRSELGYAVATAFKLNEKVSYEKPLMFKDVARTDLNADSINALYYAGVSKGSNGSFGANQLLTRSQFALFVARAMDKQFSLAINQPNKTIIAKGKAKVNNLNIRTSPSTSGKVVGQLHTGNTFNVIKDHDTWIEIQYYNQPAYISKSKEYIDFLDSDSQIVGASTHHVKVATKDGTALNVRSLPSINGTIINTLKNGDVVSVHTEKNGWSLITVNNIPGYVNTVHTEKTDVVTPGGDPAPTTGKLLGKVTANSLNVRAGQGTNFPVIYKVTRGQKVEVTALNGYWATIKLNDQVGYVHKSYLKLLNQSATKLKDRIIILDAGHGGSDPGTSKNGVTEKSITLKVSKLVEAKLQRAGAKVLMTRSGDSFPTLQARTDYAKKNFAETFVSIHVNSAGATSAKGTEVFYDSSVNPNADESKVLAQYILNNIVKQANMIDRGVKNEKFYVIRNNNVAAVLVELGFLTNADDYKKLTSDKYLEIYAEAIYQGIAQYYTVD